MRLPTPRVLAALLLSCLVLAPPAGASGRTAPPPAHIGSVAILPFVSRGAGPEAWPALRDVLRRELSRRRVTLVREETVEEELRRLRLRDSSILLHEEMEALARTLQASRLLLGYVYRVSEKMTPAVAFSGRIIDPAGRRIEAMTFVARDASGMEGALGSGDPVKLDRVMEAAVRSFVDALLSALRSPGKMPDMLKDSLLAPNPAAYFSSEVDVGALRRVLVLPFRNRAGRPGSGQAAADLSSWSIVSTGGASVVEAGDATRRLLERGWRTGAPVGTEAIMGLALDPGVDAVLMGSIDKWIEPDPRSGRVPEIGLSARLLETRTGKILWAADHDRAGDETRLVYEIGNVRLPEVLLARASYEMLEPLLKRWEKTARKGP